MGKIKNNVELVSLHIPKTAGTAFRTVLQDQLGKKCLAKFDIRPSGVIEFNNKPFDKISINSKIKGIHGHFNFKDLQEKIELHPNVKYITWLREPVARVVSNYLYLNKMIAERLNEKPDERLMAQMGKTLLEFAAVESNQNVMSKFLDGATLDTFSFVGIQGQFENELKRLEKIMGWPSVGNRMHNVTGVDSPNLSSETIEAIRNFNQADIDLYEQAIVRSQTEI